MQFDAGSLISSCMRMHKMLCLMLSIYCGLAQLKYQPANVSKPHGAMEPNVNNGPIFQRRPACRVDK
jgi:hypothetical protein